MILTVSVFWCLLNPYSLPPVARLISANRLNSNEGTTGKLKGRPRSTWLCVSHRDGLTRSIACPLMCPNWCSLRANFHPNGLAPHEANMLVRFVRGWCLASSGRVYTPFSLSSWFKILPWSKSCRPSGGWVPWCSPNIHRANDEPSSLVAAENITLFLFTRFPLS